jgi:UDP:flavonoid glycosyltransferase YjiC (YdhE family)
VTLETWRKWREHVEREGMRFAAAPEYQVFPTVGRALKPYEAAVKASATTLELIRSLDPEVVVADILTVAAALAAELDARPWVTLVPHVLPTGEPGFPVYAVGAVYPRTPVGRRMWGLARPLLMRGEEQGRVELNETRRLVGLPPLEHAHGGISRRLALVATFPQLEYPRVWPQPGARIVGPLLWEQPYAEVELPPGDAPLVLIAPSTSQDPKGRLLRAALDGLAEERVRVIASTNRKSEAGRGESGPSGARAAQAPPVPPNARLVEWLSYARTMPRCAAVV